MTLPQWLRPWWPVLKRLHLIVTRVSGHIYRAASPLLGARAVPRSATSRVTETAYLEPESVTVHPGRAGELLTRVAVVGEPAGHWAFARAREAAVPATFTLEIRGGRLTGDYAAASTPGKILDLETSGYFGVWDWRDHPIFLRPTLGEIEHVDGSLLSLTARGTAQNYYHFLYDAIARLGIAQQCLPDQRFDAILVPHAASYQRQLLELAGVNDLTPRLIQPERSRTVSADRVLIPSNPNWALDAPPAAVAWLRERLRPRVDPGAGPVRLYLTRGQAPHTRRYVEEDQLWPELERRGFRKVDPGTLPVQDQIDLFSRAEVVVAPHGAALANLTFAPGGVRVLELFASTYVHLGLWAICQATGAEYHYLVADGAGRPDGANAGTLDDVSIRPARVVAVVDRLLG